LKEINKKIYILDSPNLRKYHAKTWAVLSRMFPEAAGKNLKINREKNDWKTPCKFFPVLKCKQCCRNVNKNVTQQRIDEKEEQRVTDETSWTLLGMPTTTAYKMMMTEYRNYKEEIMAGE